MKELKASFDAQEPAGQCLMCFQKNITNVVPTYVKNAKNKPVWRCSDCHAAACIDEADDVIDMPAAPLTAASSRPLQQQIDIMAGRIIQLEHLVEQLQQKLDRRRSRSPKRYFPRS